MAAWILCPFIASAAPLLSINPVHMDFTASPGDHFTGSFKFWNGTTADLPIHLQAADFKPQGEEGEILVDGEEAPANSLKEWVTPALPDVIVPAGEEPTLDFSLDVPRDAEPGSHWGTLLAVTSPQAAGATTDIVTRFSLVILVRVGGDTREKLTLESFSLPRFTDSVPVPITARFGNEGTVHVAPQGVVEVRNIFGALVATGTLPIRNVLPGAIRKVETAVGEEGFWLGRYSVFLRTWYGQAEPTTVRAHIWIVPWKRYGPWALGAVVLLTIIFWEPRRSVFALRILLTGRPPGGIRERSSATDRTNQS